MEDDPGPTRWGLAKIYNALPTGDRTPMHAEPTAATLGRASGKYRKARSLIVLAVCEVLAMSLCFSASAVVPVLKAQYGIGGGKAAALSSSVALGFVAGTLLSALLGLADRLDPRRFFTASALLGAAANGAAALFAPSSMIFIVLRFVVGATIAGIYPVRHQDGSDLGNG
jgi:MFS family permease